MLTINLHLNSSPPLPIANQDHLAAPIPPKLAATLHRFNLCLVHHPALLVCTHAGCSNPLPVVPVLKTVEGHLHLHRHQLDKQAIKTLKDILGTLQLDSPAMTSINMHLLQANIIPKLPVQHDGYRCTLCAYAVMSKSSISAHNHKEHNSKAGNTHLVSLQLIHKSGLMPGLEMSLSACCSMILPIALQTAVKAAFQAQSSPCRVCTMRSVVKCTRFLISRIVWQAEGRLGLAAQGLGLVGCGGAGLPHWSPVPLVAWHVWVVEN